ncbi:MAG: low molecular weight phosphatase family protein, partial [Pseudomonadota bacterium]
MNAIRSPMASAITRYLFPRRIYASSAGARAGERDGFAIEAMDEIGIDMTPHDPKELEDLQDASFDLIVTLAPEAHHRALEFTRGLAVDVEYWPTEDPSLATGSRDQRLDAYRRVRDSLMKRI